MTDSKTGLGQYQKKILREITVLVNTNENILNEKQMNRIL